MIRIVKNMTAWVLLLSLWGFGPASAATFHGKARVINGDTLVINGKRIGLYGIDAPKDQYHCIIKNKRSRCGSGAGPALARKINRRHVSCVAMGGERKKRYRKARLLAVCHAGKDNLSEWMLKVGWAEEADGGYVAPKVGVARVATIAKPPSNTTRPKARPVTKPATLPKQASLPVSHGPMGSARVIDGNTLLIGGRRVTLFGIDAPESRQTCGTKGKIWQCGQSASIALTKLIGTQSLHCHQRENDGAGWIASVCRLTDDSGEDIGATMVRRGWAMADRLVSTDYAEQEQEARLAKRGIWRAAVIAPWEWRKTNEVPRENQPIALVRQKGARSCVIKGSISSKGKRIYHVRGGQHYGKMGINPSKGERWFCSEAEARSAGWRKSAQ